jgi:ABC-type transport auxiliary lipoprotein component
MVDWMRGDEERASSDDQLNAILSRFRHRQLTLPTKAGRRRSYLLKAVSVYLGLNMIRQRTLLGLACVTAMLASLTGCAGKTRYPNYYVLNVPAPPVPDAAQSKPLLSSVAVRELRALAFLRAGPIVYRKSAEQIDYYDYHRWAVDPRSA